MIGFAVSGTSWKPSTFARESASRLPRIPCSACSLMSRPALNTRPSPVSTIVRTCSSAIASIQAPPSSSPITCPKALRRSGRFIVMTATWPSTS